ncbi:hypothetical protein NP493_1317g00028 [Ridgeia piscesae]|uniref:Uncharacterized protein n=1 Tax=Ridgeia piscesae TaxID=27915 RepID=A0AAD9K7U7_RIDPI|nr:hypothetical protein NP493_1317g00028 [Ridgeia piscesae]
MVWRSRDFVVATRILRSCSRITISPTCHDAGFLIRPLFGNVTTQLRHARLVKWVSAAARYIACSGVMCAVLTIDRMLASGAGNHARNTSIVSSRITSTTQMAYRGPPPFGQFSDWMPGGRPRFPRPPPPGHGRGNGPRPPWPPDWSRPPPPFAGSGPRHAGPRMPPHPTENRPVMRGKTS